MAIRETTSIWWGLIAAVAIVVGSGFYSKGNVEPNDHIASSVVSSAFARADQTSY